MSVPFDAVEPYYRAAVLGLRALDAREGRSLRFGPEADSRWARFRGRLDDADRLLLLLRDAAAPWGIAFSAAQIFRLPGVATDEPFGPTWILPNEAAARRYLATTEGPTLAGVAAVLGVRPERVTLPELRPNTRLVVAGAAAILATANAFAARPDLDWSRQVSVAAEDPQPRQLAGLASILVGAVKPCPVVTAAAAASLPGTHVVSANAEAPCREALR